jgi:cell division protein FtsL
MIATQAVRLVSASLEWGPSAAGKARRSRRAGSAVTLRRERTARSLRLHTPAVVRTASWDLRIFGLAIAAIVFCFSLAVLYVTQTTALSVAGYDVQRLAAQRDEIRRQNSLLEIQGARLDSPARIAADAQRLGMIHARYVPVIPAQSLTAKR